ncbi:MAG: radical SAM protein [Clostridia bacterium]|nr:radical SAM protein [Clostridia bacterium]
MNDCQSLLPDAMRQLSRWARENTVPLEATFELTPFCNFDCVMCYVKLTKEQAEKQGEPLSAEKWLEIARQAKDMGTLYLSLTGGEIFAHPHFWEIYGELNKMGFLISLLTNGSLIDEEVIEKFREYGMPYFIKITLYGASNETYFKTCGVNDGFTRVEKAIDLLVAEKVPLKLTATVVKENACDLQKMYNFAREKKIPLQHTISVVQSSRGSEKDILSSRFDFADFPEEITVEMLEKTMNPNMDSVFAWCGSYRKAMWVTWHGNLQMCAFVTRPAVKYSGDLKNDWKSLYEKCENIKNPPQCKNCLWKAFCQRCPGVLCAESGDAEKTSPDFCRSAERLFDLYNYLKEGVSQ